MARLVWLAMVRSNLNKKRPYPSPLTIRWSSTPGSLFKATALYAWPITPSSQAKQRLTKWENSSLLMYQNIDAHYWDTPKSNSFPPICVQIITLRFQVIWNTTHASSISLTQAMAQLPAFEAHHWLWQTTAMECSSASLSSTHNVDHSKPGLKSSKHLLLPRTTTQVREPDVPIPSMVYLSEKCRYLFVHSGERSGQTSPQGEAAVLTTD